MHVINGSDQLVAVSSLTSSLESSKHLFNKIWIHVVVIIRPPNVKDHILRFQSS